MTIQLAFPMGAQPPDTPREYVQGYQQIQKETPSFERRHNKKRKKTAEKTRNAARLYASPSSVSRNARVVRARRRVPIRPSSRAISLLTAEGVRSRVRAAAENPPSRTTLTNTSISPERSIAIRGI